MRKWHKWLGLILSFFFVMFALSGIFLNHRKAISGIDVPRAYLPSGYRYDNWNNGALKGTLELSSDSVLLYGGAGLFVADTLGRKVVNFEKGLKKGADNRIIGNIVKTRDGDTYAISTFDLYRLDRDRNNWLNQSALLDTNERISDLQTIGDSLIVLTRSHLFVSLHPYDSFERIELKAPEDYKKESSLFRFMWTLHSGELFGILGKLFVDILGAVSILLCLTGIIFTFFPKLIRWRKTKKLTTKSFSAIWKKSLKIHNKLGVALLAFLFILVLSGMFLRPPLLIAIIRTKVSALPGTVLDNDNPWFDKLRCIRYDRWQKEWILYSSDGFYRMRNFNSKPEKMQLIPPVSVMGVTLLEQQDSVRWLVGSFNGLYYWNKQTGKSIDAYTLKPAVIKRGGPPVITDAVSGYTADFMQGEIIFDYNKGARALKPGTPLIPMSGSIEDSGRISLWHLCLEVHAGRIYSPIIGIFSDLFIFLSGMLLLSMLLSGYIVYRKHYKKKKSSKLLIHDK